MKTFILPAENWETVYARSTLEAVLRHAKTTDVVFAPHFLSPDPETSNDRRTRYVDVGPYFLARPEVEQRLRAQCRDPGAITLSAGSLPDGDSGLEYWGAVRHKAPRKPRHTIRKLGKLDIVAVDTGPDYYRHLSTVGKSASRWFSYAAGEPVFAHNTNAFAEKPPPSCDHYFILASGLLGMRMILESNPAPDADIVLFDINPDQLTWAKFVLDKAAGCADFATLLAGFTQEHPEVAIRPVEPHERANADRQEAWYARNHKALGALNRFDPSFVTANILHDPEPIFSRLSPDGRTFCMYLDVFFPWLPCERRVTVLDLRNLAAAFRDEVRARTNEGVSFLPESVEQQAQLTRSSPWWEE